MRIKHFRFTDSATGWHLEEATFDGLNLLVGISGVGKTKIIEALQRVHQFAVDENFDPGAMEWSVVFEHEGIDYLWEGCTEKGSMQLGEASLGKERSRVVRELLGKQGETLVERTAETLMFMGKELPKLPRSDSAITLFREESVIRPVLMAFHRFVFSEIVPKHIVHTFYRQAKLQEALRTLRPLMEEGKVEPEDQRRRVAEGAYALLATVSPEKRGAGGVLNVYLYIVQELFPEDFISIKELFTSSFPFVEELRMDWTPGTETEGERLELRIRERGMETWIPATQISSGMLRTLSLIVEIRIAHPGSVIVVDEIESSLGVNCMPQVTELLVERSDCQFILTSHHPYIIDNIPVHAWKLVHRHGSRVRIDSVTSLPNFDPTSRHRAFLQLINMPEYEEGIA